MRKNTTSSIRLRWRWTSLLNELRRLRRNDKRSVERNMWMRVRWWWKRRKINLRVQRLRWRLSRITNRLRGKLRGRWRWRRPALRNLGLRGRWRWRRPALRNLGLRRNDDDLGLRRNGGTRLGFGRRWRWSPPALKRFGFGKRWRWSLVSC